MCVICIFWSRSIIHTLTLIKWPLEFGHNFLYIACALGEALLFTRLDRPLAWFRLSTAYAAFVWLLFVYDLRLIRARLRETTTEAERLLYQRTWEDQLLNIRLLMPCLFLFNLACALAISHWPDYFLERAGNVWLIAAQFLSFRDLPGLRDAILSSNCAPDLTQPRSKNESALNATEICLLPTALAVYVISSTSENASQTFAFDPETGGS